MNPYILKTVTVTISFWVCHVKRIMESSASKEFIHPSGHSPGDTEGVDVVAFSVYSSAQKMFLICSMFNTRESMITVVCKYWKSGSFSFNLSSQQIAMSSI